LTGLSVEASGSHSMGRDPKKVAISQRIRKYCRSRRGDQKPKPQL